MKAAKKTMITTDALIIREMNVGESDKLVTLLTRDFGVIKAFSTGAKKISSKNFSASTLLTFGNFSLVKTNDTYKITEGSVIESFFTVGMDLTALSLAQYFCELAAVLSPEESPAEEYLRLILNSLHFLVQGKMYSSQLKALTEFRLAAMSGYMPDLVACHSCAAYEDDLMYFELQSGELFCSRCKAGHGNLVAIDRTVLTAMRHILYAQFEKLYSFKIPPDRADTLSDLTERFLTYHCEHHFPTLDFYKTIK